jgi:hypothetical protein
LDKNVDRNMSKSTDKSVERWDSRQEEIQNEVTESPQSKIQKEELESVIRNLKKETFSRDLPLNQASPGVNLPANDGDAMIISSQEDAATITAIDSGRTKNVNSTLVASTNLYFLYLINT